MAVSVAERQFLLSQVNQLAQADLDRLWNQAASLADIDFASLITSAYPELVDPYNSMASSLSATWFELSDPQSDYIAKQADPIPVEKILKTTQWALGASGTQGRNRLAGSLQRSVLDGARDTTILNVEATNSRWIRVARVGACPFCKMLATRKDAYRSSNTAGRDVHDDCHCQPVEVREGHDWKSLVGSDYLKTVSQWDDEYLKARAEAGTGSPKALLSAWRQIDALPA